MAYAGSDHLDESDPLADTQYSSRQQRRLRMLMALHAVSTEELTALLTEGQRRKLLAFGTCVANSSAPAASQYPPPKLQASASAAAVASTTAVGVAPPAVASTTTIPATPATVSPFAHTPQPAAEAVARQRWRASQRDGCCRASSASPSAQARNRRDGASAAAVGRSGGPVAARVASPPLAGGSTGHVDGVAQRRLPAQPLPHRQPVLPPQPVALPAAAAGVATAALALGAGGQDCTHAAASPIDADDSGGVAESTRRAYARWRMQFGEPGPTLYLR